MIRRLVLGAVASPAGAGVIGMLERATAADPQRLAVLTYHRVDDPGRRPDLYPGLISATPAQFEEQMAYVAAQLHPIGLDELLAVRAGSARLAPRSVMITFDDAYRDVVEQAAPILARRSLPSVLFVPTAYPADDTRAFWWDRLHAALRAGTPPIELRLPGGVMRISRMEEVGSAFRRLTAAVKQMPHPAAMRTVDELLAQLPAVEHQPAVATWDELRRVNGDGMALAPHSHTHPRLDRLSPDALRHELERPRVVFREQLGADAPPVLAYPDGAHDAAVVRAAGAAGYVIALTTARGTNSMRAIDWLRLRRINVGPRSSLALIRMQLLATRRLARPSNHRVDEMNRPAAPEEATTWN
jgi:peptidoglycan/xylan/chitin deacetylase (PgdA/CDA1 family)